jgi:hypothetical protein
MRCTAFVRKRAFFGTSSRFVPYTDEGLRVLRFSQVIDFLEG